MAAPVQADEHLQHHEAEMVRKTAAKALAMIGDKEKREVVSQIVATLTYFDDYSAAIEAARVLGTLRHHSDIAVTELATYLRHGVNCVFVRHALMH